MLGSIILLNGTSSSGKTSIARSLQLLLPTPWIYLSADVVLGGYPFDHPAADSTSVWRPLGHQFYETVSRFAAAGFDVIAEQVFQNPLQLEDAVEVMAEDRVWFVGVRCDLEVAEVRERSRHDGTALGTARAQVDKVHRHVRYDIEVDSTRATSESMAADIAEQLGAEPTAFEKLRQQRSPQSR